MVLTAENAIGAVPSPDSLANIARLNPQRRHAKAPPVIALGENASFIIKINEIINKNINDTSGYRKIPVFIRGADFVPPEPALVPRMMQEQLYFYHNSTLPLLMRIAEFHIQFEHIHPFEDGNGRTGRLLINHELIRNNETPIVIPDTRRAEYFEYLANYNISGFANMINELQDLEQEKMNSYFKESIEQGLDEKEMQ